MNARALPARALLLVLCAALCLLTAAPRAEAAVVPGIEAHAGGAGVGPANSLKLFATSIEAGVKVIELDVQLTRDKVAVLNHDDRVTDISARTAAGDGVLRRDCDHDGALIHLLTYAQVQQIRCAGQPLPSLAEVIALVKPSHTTLNVELKTWDDVPGGTRVHQSSASRRDYAQRIVRQLLAAGMKGRFLVSSFAWRNIIATVKAIDPAITFLAIEHAHLMSQAGKAVGYSTIRDAAARGADGFAMDLRHAQVDYLRLIKALGMYPMLWHNLTDGQSRFAIANGVRYLSANDPADAKKLLEALDGHLPTETVVRHTIRTRTVLSATLAARKAHYPRITHGSGLVPASAQSQLLGVQLLVTVTGTGKGAVDITPRGSRAGVDGLRIAIPNGTVTTTIDVSPGDKGALRVASSVRAKVTMRVFGWTSSSYEANA